MTFLVSIFKFLNSKGKNTLALLFLWTLVLIQVSPYVLSSRQVAGWDSPGHYHLAEVYDDMFSSFKSRGYDPDWFRGFPAFYYYPTLLYFISSAIKLLIPFINTTVQSFNLTLVLTLLFLTFSLFRFAKIVIPEHIKESPRILGAIAAVLVYFIYPGYGPQGVSLVGFIEGTYNTALGTALIISSLYWLEIYRRSNHNINYYLHILSLSLLFYSHFLSAAFGYIIIGIYYIFYRNRFSFYKIGLSFLIPFLLSLPMTAPLFFFSEWSTGQSVITRYNGLISLLGTDLIKILIKTDFRWNELIWHLIVHFGIIHFAVVISFLSVFFTIPVRRKHYKFIFYILTCSVMLFWITQDPSLTYLLPFLPFHWYRTFDLFYLFLSIASILPFMLSTTGFRNNSSMLLLPVIIALTIRFMIINPLEQQNNLSRYYNGDWKEKESFSSFSKQTTQIPEGSLVFTELVANNSLHGSPHFFDTIVQKSKLRNLNGLMIESSYTSILNDIFISSAIPGFFIWGRNPRWLQKNIHPESQNFNKNLYFSTEYLNESGVNYIFARTDLFRSILNSLPEFAALVFHKAPYSIYKLKKEYPSIYESTSPSGYINASLFDSSSVSTKDLLEEFNAGVYSMMKSYDVSPSRIVNLDPVFQKHSKQLLGPGDFHSLIIFNHGKLKKAPVVPNSWLNSSTNIVFINMKPSGDQSIQNNNANIYYLSAETNNEITDAKYRTIVTGADTPQHKAINISRDKNGISFELAESENISKITKSCHHVYMTDSFSSFWRTDTGIPVYQTGINGTYMCANNTSNRVRYYAPLSKTLTAFMLLLLLTYSGMEISSYRKTKA